MVTSEEVAQMRELFGLPALIVGVAAIVVGLLLQAGGAAAVIFCSVVGGGILLTVIGFFVWAIGTFTHRKPTALGG
jgi:hypothetical protein